MLVRLIQSKVVLFYFVLEVKQGNLVFFNFGTVVFFNLEAIGQTCLSVLMKLVLKIFVLFLQLKHLVVMFCSLFQST